MKSSARRIWRNKRWLMLGVVCLAGAGAVMAAATQMAGNDITSSITGVVSQGNVYQLGRNVGWATGAKSSASDSSIIAFDEISNARGFAHASEFEYRGSTLKIVSIRKVDYSTDGARPEAILRSVVAKVVRGADK